MPLGESRSFAGLNAGEGFEGGGKKGCYVGSKLGNVLGQFGEAGVSFALLLSHYLGEGCGFGRYGSKHPEDLIVASKELIRVGRLLIPVVAQV